MVLPNQEKDDIKKNVNIVKKSFKCHKRIKEGLGVSSSLLNADTLTQIILSFFVVNSRMVYQSNWAS